MVAKPIVRVEWKRSGHGWTVGTVSYKKKTYHFSIKTFIERSVYGIDKGCISKLDISEIINPNLKIYEPGRSKAVARYDRGWDIRPIDADAKAVLNALKARFNNGMNAKDLENYKKYVW